MKYPEQDFSPKPRSPAGYIRLGLIRSWSKI